MKSMTILLSLLLTIVVACSPTAETIVQVINESEAEAVDSNPAEDQSVPEPTAEPTEIENPDPTSTDEMMEAEPTVEANTSSTVDYNGPAWTNLELVNANTGETFTLADFAGKTVFIEPMATWCPICRGQQQRISQVIDQLNPDEFVVVSLSIETFLSPEELASYSVNNGFNWTFAVASDELLSALVAEFGRSISSAPSVPHFTISANGTAGNFATGGKSGEEFLQLVRAVALSS